MCYLGYVYAELCEGPANCTIISCETSTDNFMTGCINNVCTCIRVPLTTIGMLNFKSR